MEGAVMTDLEADLKIAQARIKELEAQLAAADVVEVVRCKYCTRREHDSICEYYEENDFCSRGERRGDAR